MKDKILITGANGQIGTVLTEALQDHYGKDQVLATDIRPRSGAKQSLVLGKSARTVTLNGNGIVPPGSDPGIDFLRNLYLLGNEEGNGVVEIIATADGLEESDAVTIVSRWLIHLPLVFNAFDVLATPAYLDPDVTPTPRRGR